MLPTSRELDEMIFDAPLLSTGDEKVKQQEFEEILKEICKKKNIVTCVGITKHFLTSLSIEQQIIFFDRIRYLERLDTIYMIAVSVSIESMTLILQATKKNLKVLSLARIRFITDEQKTTSLSSFYDALSNQSNLEEFELSLGRCDDNDVEINLDKVCEALVNIKTLKEVKLRRRLSSNVRNSISVSHLERLSNSIEHLALENINLSHEHCQALEKVLCCCHRPPKSEGPTTRCCLRSLNLDNANISNVGAIMITTALKNSYSSLERLSLSRNGLGDVVAISLARVLKRNTTLKVLDLRNNDLGYQTCKELGKALEGNESLSVLDLSFNKLGDVGGRILALGLEKNRGLETLHLLQTNVGNETLMTFGRILKHNARLRSLNLNLNNAISGTSVEKMTSELEQDNFHLENLQVNLPTSEQEQKWSTLYFLLKLNQLGKHEILKSNSEAEWVNRVSHASHDLSCLYFFLHANPGIVGSTTVATTVAAARAR